MLEKLFGSRTRAKLLEIFILEPGRSWYQRQLARELGISLPSIQKELGNLSRLGIIEELRQGYPAHYRINKEFLLFNELRQIFIKTSGIAGRLREALKDIKGLKCAFIFGSIAKSVDTIYSDIDLLAIGKTSLHSLAVALTSLREELGREINIALFEPGEFAERVAAKNGFVTRVLKSRRIFVKGDKDVLNRLTKGRTTS